jgi:hypothetical protein
VRWILKELRISRSRFGVLVDRHEDCLDVAIAPPLTPGSRNSSQPQAPAAVARKLNRKKGHRSAPYTKMPGMMTGLRYDPGNAARCTEVGILTVSRSQEIRLMEWTELDFEARTWMVPAENED